MTVMEAVVAAWAMQRDEIEGAAPRTREQLGAIGRMPRLRRRRRRRRSLDEAVPALLAVVRRGQRRLRLGAEVPAGERPRPAARPRRARARRADPRRDGGRRHPRPARRRLRALLGRRRLDRPPLREDALRQRPPRPHLPPRPPRARPRALPRRRDRHLRVGAARDAGARRAASTPPSTPTRRASRGSSTPGPRPRRAPPSTGPASTTLEPDRPGPLRDRPSAVSSRDAACSTCRGASTRPSRRGSTPPRRRCSPNATRGSGPGLDDKRLCAWNALMAGSLAEVGAALGEPRYVEAARRCADFVLADDARRRRPPAAHLQRRSRPPQRLPRGPRLPARGAPDALRVDVRGPLVRRGRPRDRRGDGRALRRRRAGRLLHDLRRPRGADRAPQGPRRPPGALRQLGRGRTACSGSPR